jgi:hypothetical protein
MSGLIAARFPDRQRFNWGFHDGVAEAADRRVRSMSQHFDTVYADGYRRGVDAWQGGGGHRPQSSDLAWASRQADIAERRRVKRQLPDVWGRRV